MTEDINFDSEGERLKELVNELEVATRKAIENKNELYGELEELSEEESALLAKVAEIKAKRHAVNEKQKVLNYEARRAQERLLDSQRKFQTFMSEKAIRDRMAEEMDALEQKSLNAYWREFAFNHQIEGAKRLAVAGRAICGDSTGLGKTITSIIWLDLIGAKRVVVIAPRDVLKNFEREVNTWAPDRKTMIVQGMPKGVRDFFFMGLASAPEFLILINYEAWRRDPDMIDQITALKPDAVICDEAHNMKEGKTKAYQGVRKLVYAENVDNCVICGSELENWENPVSLVKTIRCSLCFREPEIGDRNSVKFVLPMTGTPIMNKPQDLFTLLHLIDRQNFHSLNHFLMDYCQQDLYTQKWYFAPGGEKRLMARLGTKIVARKPDAADVKMPDLIKIPHILEFEPGLYQKQFQAIKQIENLNLEMMSDGFELIIPAIIAMYTRLRQAVTWPAGIKVRDPKTKAVIYECDVQESIILDKVDDIVDDAVDEGDRVIVFSQFKEVLKEMESRLNKRGITCVRLDGDTSDAMRDEITLEFDSKSVNDNPDIEMPYDEELNPRGYKWKVLLANYKVGGTGLNLDLARQVIFADRGWNPATEEQAVNRTRRMNTKHKSVVLHTIHVQKTVTTWMDSLIQYKAEMQEGFNNDINMAESFIQAMRDGFE